MHSLSRPWIFGTRSRSSSDCIRFFTDISKFSRRCAVIVCVAIQPVRGLLDLLLEHACRRAP